MIKAERRAVVGLVKYDGDILLGKKTDSVEGLLSGKWHVPGETLEPEEDFESALVRGIFEEAGIVVEILKYLAFHRSPKNTLVKWYECRALSRDILPGSDLEEVKWVPRNEVASICAIEGKNLWPREIRDYFQIRKV